MPKDFITGWTGLEGMTAIAVAHPRLPRFRSVQVLVYNDKGEVLLQRRSPLKDTAPVVHSFHVPSALTCSDFLPVGVLGPELL